MALQAEEKKLPKLLDLGSKKCIPCKKMAPILEELKKDYADKFVTEFIDVWVKENAAKAQEYKIETIPTQIFFNAEGKELFRHVGFYSKEEILDKFRGLGVDFGEKSDSDTIDLSATNINPDTGRPCVVRKEPEKAQSIIEITKDQPAPEYRFIVYFFCSGGQCPCSGAIEIGAYNTLVKYFSADMKSGKIEWKKLDVAEEEHAHFADEYELEPLDHLHDGLVIVEIKGNKRGRWKNLIEADMLKDTDDEYTAYVKKEVETFIRGDIKVKTERPVGDPQKSQNSKQEGQKP